MHIVNRILLAAGVILLDFLIFFVPLTGLFFAYILIFNPPWFREFLNSLNGPESKDMNRDR